MGDPPAKSSDADQKTGRYPEIQPFHRSKISSGIHWTSQDPRIRVQCKYSWVILYGRIKKQIQSTGHGSYRRYNQIKIAVRKKNVSALIGVHPQNDTTG